MPFIESIVSYINSSLKERSFNDKRFQPSLFFGCTTVLARKKGEALEVLPAVLNESGEYTMIEPRDHLALSVYHKTISNGYGYVKKSHGDQYEYRCTTEMAMVIINNSKRTGVTAEKLEPLFVYGMPQRLSKSAIDQFKFSNCLITPLASDMDVIRVFKGEYPQSIFFLKPFQQLFLLRYRIETTFDKSCIDECLCG